MCTSIARAQQQTQDSGIRESLLVLFRNLTKTNEVSALVSPHALAGVGQKTNELLTSISFL